MTKNEFFCLFLVCYVYNVCVDMYGLYRWMQVWMSILLPGNSSIFVFHLTMGPLGLQMHTAVPALCKFWGFKRGC